MPQGKKNLGPSRAVQSLNDSNPRTLADNMKLVRRDGGVYLQTTILTAALTNAVWTLRPTQTYAPREALSGTTKCSSNRSCVTSRRRR